ncbi:MAG TPA: undecaprenyldiphospho-muramoylpentapeptide beta-N-acetylglucosaminyltransferase [Polyangiaceae bacterium]|nr:undecaprenyldiphospho-muramoylpentapeptide beta-N-acetylglucosaminyltransferase [Polyangiaceae bacterium]
MTTIVFAGGGTGGHVFPLIAVADAVRALAPEIALVFVGTERGLETKVVPERGYALELLRVLPIRGNGALGAVRGAAQALTSIPKARALLARHAPSAVFSIGGYAAGPVSVAARSLRIPLAVMEPNSAIGLANRVVAPLVQRAYTAFPESERHFSPSRVLRTGVPLRQGFRPVAYEPGAELRVLVLGGSQGAASLNDAVPRALAAVKARVSVVHQAGAGKDEAVRALYAELGKTNVARVVPFIDDMPRALGAADLVIGRAGAGAVAEICAVGRPSLLIPYPFAGDHQRHNAEWLEREGAALMVLAHDATVPRLTTELGRLATDGALLRRMADDATRLGRPDAAVVIARDLLGLAGVRGQGHNGAIYVPRDEAPEGGRLARSTERGA